MIAYSFKQGPFPFAMFGNGYRGRCCALKIQLISVGFLPGLFREKWLTTMHLHLADHSSPCHYKLFFAGERKTEALLRLVELLYKGFNFFAVNGFQFLQRFGLVAQNGAQVFFPVAQHVGG